MPAPRGLKEDWASKNTVMALETLTRDPTY